MKETFFFSGKVLAAILLTYGALSIWKPGLPGPEPAPKIITPAVVLQDIVKPITELLNDNGSHGQASILAAFYFEASKTIRRDGNHGRILKTKDHLRTFCVRAATLRFQGIFKGVPGLSATIHGKDGVLSKIIGLEAGVLDHEKSADALHAVAWACQEAR